jgi:hypothetical protein
MSEENNYGRRRFFSTAAMTIAAAQLGMLGSADAQSGKESPADVPPIKPGTNTSFGPRASSRRPGMKCWPHL